VEAIQSRCQQDAPFGSIARRSDASHAIVKLARGENEAIATLHAGLDDDEGHSFQLDPRVLNMAWQLLGVASNESTVEFTPHAIDQLCLYGPLPDRLLVHAGVLPVANASLSTLSGDIRLFDAEGTIIAEMLGLRLAPAHDIHQTQSDGLTRESLLGTPPDERQHVLVSHVRAELARVLGIAEGRIDVEQPLDSMGLDSLMAIQLQSRIEQGLGLRLSPMDLLLGPTLQELAEIVLERLPTIEEMQPDRTSVRYAQATESSASAPVETNPMTGTGDQALEADVAKLEQLSDEELDSLLKAMLAEEGEST
jgi:acyl carrier protein